MKKVLFFAAAVAAMMLASCKPSEYEVVVNDPADANLVTITITANLDQATKATINDAEKKWVWSEGDHLAVFDGVAKRDFTLTAGAGTAIATFTGSIDPGAGALDAIFPYAAAAGDDFAAGYVIPATQTVTAEAVVDPNALVATATGAKDGDDYNFTFTSAVSFIRFSSDAAGKFIFHAVDKEDSLTGDGRAVVVNAPAAGTWWVAVKPASYTGIRVFRRISGHDYMLSSASTLDLATPGKAREFGTINSTANEVKVIETADELIAYLGGSPALDAYVVDDLDLTAKVVSPCESFNKVFDGQYHKLSNWDASNALFTTNDGTVQNVVIDNTCAINWTSTIDAGTGIAFIVAKANTGYVKNCVVAGSITINSASAGVFYCAGVVGQSTTGYVDGCSFSGSVDVTLTNTSADFSSIGGVVAMAGDVSMADKSIIKDCLNEGSVSFLFSGAAKKMKKFGVGGVLGSTVTIASATNNYGTIENCENRGAIEWEYTAGGSGSYPAMGGVAGIVEGKITGCNNYGNIAFSGSKSTATTQAHFGGVAGYVTLDASDCHNYGEITLDCAFSGGTALNQNGGNTSLSSFGGVFGGAGPFVDNGSSVPSSNTISKGITVTNCTNEKALVLTPCMPGTGGPRYSIGGVVGAATAALTNCHNNKDLTVTSNTKFIVCGGVAGCATSHVTNCSNKGNVLVDGDKDNNPVSSQQHYIGGLLGYILKGTTISACSNTGDVTMQNVYTTAGSLSYVGGIIGTYSGGLTMSNTSNSGNITNSADTPLCLGGLGGGFNGTMTECSNSGTIQNASTYTSATAGKESEVGGLAGYCYATITDCENTGTVNNAASGGFAGGFCGGINGVDDDKTWTNSTINCTISGSASKGAVIGRFRQNTGSNVLILGAAEEPITIRGGAASLPLAGFLNGHSITETNVVTE